jgi:signal transduction histidine kinase
MPGDRGSKPSIDADTQAFGARIRLKLPGDTTPLPVQPVRLVCVVGPDLGRSFPLRKESVLLGRGEDADITVASTDTSRHHARITVATRDLAIEDLGSRNGTQVNGMDVKGLVPLQVGDRVQIGSTIFVVTRQDELEERLKQLEKLDAMAALVKGLAHDFNNMLSVLQGGIVELSETLPASEAALHATLADMANAAESAASLVKRLKQVGRETPPAPDEVEIDALVEETVALARRLPMPEVDVRTDVAPGMRVRGSREELRNALLNLLVNARDAMPRGGAISITAGLEQLDRATALERHLAAEGPYVQLLVEDTGTGMNEATLARVFEPFFTTKPPGKGSGLGLAMVFGTVRNHRGAISIESAVGRGTRVRMLLPAA